MPTPPIRQRATGRVTLADVALADEIDVALHAVVEPPARALVHLQLAHRAILETFHHAGGGVQVDRDILTRACRPKQQATTCAARATRP